MDLRAADVDPQAVNATKERLALLTSREHEVLEQLVAGKSNKEWFGRRAPEGHEDNWVQTMPDKSWNVLLRLYGPLKPWFDQSWKPGNIELVQ